MMIILNPNAGGGTASEKWARIQDSLSAPDEPIAVRSAENRSALPLLIEQAALSGERHFVAAGGDGTVHELLNAMVPLAIERKLDVALGAIGLGSSNDFHKPFIHTQVVRGVPLRVDFLHARKRDVGLVEVENDVGVTRRYFLINASIGLTAEGNAFFNAPDSFLRWLKKHSTGMAITYAALRSIISYRNEMVRTVFGANDERRFENTNLGIVKNPCFSGGLHYDAVPDYTNGELGVFAAKNFGFFGRLNLLCNLSRGRFSGLPNTFSKSEPEITVEVARNVAIEVDGEILVGRRAHFSVLQNSLLVCA